MKGHSEIMPRIELPQYRQNRFICDSVLVKDFYDNRTQQQNRLLRKWERVIADELGYSFDEIDALIHHLFFNAHQFDFLGEVVTVYKSTKDLNIKEFSYKLDKIKNWAWFTLSIKLPDPEDLIYQEKK